MWKINCFLMWQKVVAVGREAAVLNSPGQCVPDSERSLRRAKRNEESSQSSLNKRFFNNLFSTCFVGLKPDAFASYPCVCAG